MRASTTASKDEYRPLFSGSGRFSELKTGANSVQFELLQPILILSKYQRRAFPAPLKRMPLYLLQGSEARQDLLEDRSYTRHLRPGSAQASQSDPASSQDSQPSQDDRPRERISAVTRARYISAIFG